VSNGRALLLIHVLLTVIALAQAERVAADIVPVDRRTTWNPGIPGGIPVRTTICATLNASTFENGSFDASGAIQAALNACPLGQVVQLSAGNFRINAGLEINKAVVLRGQGPALTRLKMPVGTNSSLVSVGQRWYPGFEQSVNLTGDAVKGATSVTLASNPGLTPGEIVLIDQITDPDISQWSVTSPPGDASRGWFTRMDRPLGQMMEVASVSGSTVSFTTPFHISYRTAFSAQLTRLSAPVVKYAGVEDLYASGGSGGQGNFWLHGAYVWARNVESGFQVGSGVSIDACFRCVLRDSYVHTAQKVTPGGGAYGIAMSWYTADTLVENNIVWNMNKVMVMRATGGGNVIGYNYMEDGWINYAPDFVEEGLNASHMTTAHYELFEGNQSFNFGGDGRWGGAVYITVFRNHLTGKRRSIPPLNYRDTGNPRAISLADGHWWYTFVGNVLGTPGQNPAPLSGYTYEDFYPWNDAPVPMWKLGYSDNWGPADTKVTSTVVRDGNFDYVTNQVRWDNPAQAIPASLYLTSKPPFFGNNPWPWVEPLTGALYTLPARVRFDGSRMGSVHFAAASYTVTEGGVVTVAVRRDPPAFAAATVDYATSDGTAKADAGIANDYAPRSGTLSFAPGQTTAIFTVTTHANTLADGARTFLLSLKNPAGGAKLAEPSTAAVAIRDDDLGGIIQFSGSTFLSNDGNAQAFVKIIRTGGAASAAAASFSASGGTAISGADYREVLAQQVVFGPGQTSQTVTVDLFDDPTVGRHKTVNLSLSGPAGGAALGARSTAVLTIQKDNPVLQFVDASFSALESASKAVITVKRSGLTTDAVTVHFATAPGTAISGTDYQDVSGDLTFAGGVLSRSFEVPVVRDGIHEPNRTVLLSLTSAQDLTNPGRAALGQQQTAVLTINDRDSTPRVQWGAAAFAVAEGAGSARVVVRRLLTAAGRVTVNYTTSNGTALAGSNYETAAGTLTFLPGEVSKTIPITIHPSVTPVGDLTVNLALSNPRCDCPNPQASAVLGSPSTALLTIRSDDPLLQFSAPAYTVGEAGGHATITVRRSGPPNRQVAVDYYDAGGGTAATPQSYSLTPGTLTFPPFVMSRSFPVTVTSDGLLHLDQTVNLGLRNPTGGAALGAWKAGVLTLATDDPRVQFTSAAYSAAESAGKATIAVRRVGPLSRAFTVPVTASNGTATSANYGAPVPSVLSFDPGVLIRSFSVPIVNDGIDQPSPLTVKLALGAPDHALLGAPKASVLTIADNDVAGVVQFAVSDYSLGQGGESAVVTVSRTGGQAGGATVRYDASDGTGAEGTNYNPASATLIFDEGQTTRTFIVDVLDDGSSTNKTVRLTLSSPGGGAVLGPRSSATLWIVAR
jgi:hypothetical protein